MRKARSTVRHIRRLLRSGYWRRTIHVRARVGEPIVSFDVGKDGLLAGDRIVIQYDWTTP
jgi:hypothetical protein